MFTKNLKTVLLVAGAIAGTLAAINMVSLPSHTILWRQTANAGHIPLFGLLALAMLRLSPMLFKSGLRRWYAHHLFALGIVTLVGFLSEYLQISGPRYADLSDLLRDIIGGIIFLALASTLPSRIFPSLAVDWSKGSARLVRLGAFLLLVASFSPLLFWSGAFLNRAQQFPLICGFESVWETSFVGAESGRVERVDPPPGWRGDQERETGKVGKYRFRVEKYPGFFIREPYPDFTGYEALTFEVFSEHESTLDLVVRINDRYHNNEYSDRYNENIRIRPGLNLIEIPLSKVRQAPITREMDMTAIAMICIFAVRPAEPFTLFVDDFCLR